MITKISSGKIGQMVYTFSNGVKLSFIWDGGSYTDNLMQRSTDFSEPKLDSWSSATVECYSIGSNSNGVEEYLDKKYGGNPAGNIPVNDVPNILRRADRDNN